MATEKPSAARLFKNKNTSVVWEVADPATLKRVLDDPQTYEEVKQEQKKPEKVA